MCFSIQLEKYVWIAVINDSHRLPKMGKTIKTNIRDRCFPSLCVDTNFA